MINHSQTALEQRPSHITTESFIPTLKIVLHDVHQLFELVFSVGDGPELAAGKACLELIANLIREGVSNQMSGLYEVEFTFSMSSMWVY